MLSPAGAVAPRHINTLYPGKKSPGKKQDAEPPSGFPLLSPSHRGFNPFSIKSDKEQKIKAKHCSAKAGVQGTRNDGAEGWRSQGNSLLTGAGVCSVSLRGIREERTKEQSRGRRAFSNLPGKMLAHSRRRRFPLGTRNPIVEQSFSVQSLPSGQLFRSESLDPPGSFP